MRKQPRLMSRQTETKSCIVRNYWTKPCDRHDNNVMHAKPDLRVCLKWMIAHSGSVITDVIPPGIHRDDIIGHARNSPERARIRIVHYATKGASIGRSFEIDSESLVHAAQSRQHRTCSVQTPAMLGSNSGHARTSSTSLGKLARMWGAKSRAEG